MGKFVGIQRIHRAILNLPLWHEKVDSQGAVHLWTILSIKRKDITTQTFKPFGEGDDKAFFDNYMRVQDTNNPYYDPLTTEFRIATHYHSNVATARKNTFVNRWRAAEYETRGNNDEYWKLSDKYLDIIKEHVLTKGKITTKVPLYDLLAWLYHTREFPDDITLDKLIDIFREEFHITPEEFSLLFTKSPIDWVPESEGKFFVDHPTSNELTLAAIKEKERFDLAETLASIQGAGKVQPVELDDVLTLMQHGRRQLILQGPPGTGKTNLARQLTALLLGISRQDAEVPTKVSEFLSRRQFSNFSEGELTPESVTQMGGMWDIVQFHPSYTYEDFVRGITSTVPSGGGFPTFQVENRVFATLAEWSTRIDDPIILIVDEINRGDLSKVLGELIYALEYRGASVRTLYNFKGSALVAVGKNLFLIATMNTADRSIALVDYAIRRRFDFIELRPDPNILKQYLALNGLSAHADRVLELFEAVSKLFETGQDYAVGHTYFMGKDTDDIARRVVFQVLPLLAEYQKEGILGEDASIPLREWPGASGLTLKHPRPFSLAAELKSWLDGGNQLTTDESNQENSEGNDATEG